MKKIHFFRHYFTGFALFNLIFLILQFAYVLSQGGSFLKAIPLPLYVHLELAAAVVIQLLLYVLLTLLQTTWLWGIEEYYSDQILLERYQLTIYILSITAILTVNCYFFPLSLFSRLFLPGIPLILIKILMGFSLLLIGLLTLNSFWRICRYRPLLISVVLGIFILILMGWFAHDRIIPQASIKTKNPRSNIIIIGIDSLSSERINLKSTPHLYKFLKEGVLFEETISPLARTYAAWSTILTGLYPLHHKARYNLMPPDEVESSESFAWTLQKLGYQTVFATDERRFSTIDSDFGFQDIIGPKLGVNDVLLGTFNDFPLSNFLINLPISRWLFPYNYLNRASHFSYYPSAFDHALQRLIEKRLPNKPLLLAVHFALPHWPYAWAASSPAKVKDEYSVEERGELYQAAIHQADEQAGTLLQKLAQTDLLENSMVIILSDHGEALYERGTRLTNPQSYQGNQKSQLADYFRRKTSTTLEMSAGHGSDLLSPSQFHTLLGFKIFKHHKLITTPRVIKTRVALIDIAPTVYSFLNIPLKKNFDGVSLLNSILNPVSPPEKRVFMLESGELPNQIVSRKKARELGKLLFMVNPDNNQLQLRKDRLAILDALKLYAILDGDWIVALYPDDYKYITVTLNLSDGKWTDDLNSSFAQSSPAKSMLKQLRQFFKKELGSYPKSQVTPDLIK